MQQPCNFDRAAFSTPAFSAPPHAVHCKTSKINSFSSFFDVAVVGLLEFVNYSEIARPYPTSTKHSSSQSKYFFSLLKTNKLCGRRVRPTRYAPPQDFWQSQGTQTQTLADQESRECPQEIYKELIAPVFFELSRERKVVSCMHTYGRTQVRTDLYVGPIRNWSTSSLGGAWWSFTRR